MLLVADRHLESGDDHALTVAKSVAPFRNWFDWLCSALAYQAGIARLQFTESPCHSFIVLDAVTITTLRVSRNVVS